MRFGPWVLLVLVALVILWAARGVLAPFIVGGVIAYAFSPVVQVAQQRTGWPRIVVIGIGYLIAVAILIVLGLLLAEPASREFATLATGGPDAIADLVRGLIGADSITIGGQVHSVTEIADALESQISALLGSPGDALHLAREIGSFLLDSFLAIVVSFYLLLDGPHLVDRLTLRVPQHRRERLTSILSHIHLILGRWMRGQLLLIALVAAVTYVILGPILHVPHSLAIAILTGILEVIPLIGPLIATAIAGTVAFSSGGPTLALIVVVVYVVIRQIEDQIVVPIVIGRFVHLHPVVTIFAVLVGLSVYGLLGGLLGVPVAAAAMVVFNEFFPPDNPEPPPEEPAPPAEEPAPA